MKREAGFGARDAGFTLIEVMVVIAVMALLLVLIVNRGPPRSAALTLRIAGADVAESLRDTRAAAIAAGAPRRFSPGALPAGVTLSATVQPPGPILFQPDGSASAAVLRLTTGNLAETLTLGWLTGRVTIGPVQPVED